MTRWQREEWGEKAMPTYKVDPFTTTYTVPEDAGGPLVCEGCGTTLQRVKARTRLTGMSAETAAEFWPEVRDLLLAHEAECAAVKK
jgi:hypothetical protein